MIRFDDTLIQCIIPIHGLTLESHRHYASIPFRYTYAILEPVAQILINTDQSGEKSSN